MSGWLHRHLVASCSIGQKPCLFYVCGSKEKLQITGKLSQIIQMAYSYLYCHSYYETKPNPLIKAEEISYLVIFSIAALSSYLECARSHYHKKWFEA